MGSNNKENVQLVISHLEGCSGNFLAYLACADIDKPYSNIFRVDQTPDDRVLSINGRNSWHEEISQRLQNHLAVVTHNYDRDLIQKTFPNAQLIQIYPYTHIGNVLYNICYKKLDLKLKNVVDNHFLDIKIWFDQIKKQKPNNFCIDYWCLHDQFSIEKLLGIKLSYAQQHFFDQYWKQQLPYNLDIPQQPASIGELVEFWAIEQDCSPWNIAWTIFVYELINGLEEQNRLWTINDANKFDCWSTVKQTVEYQYH